MYSWLEILPRIVDGTTLLALLFVYASPKRKTKWPFILAAAVYGLISFLILRYTFDEEYIAFFSIAFAFAASFLFMEGRTSTKCLAASFSAFVLLVIHYETQFVVAWIANRVWEEGWVAYMLSMRRAGHMWLYIATGILQVGVAVILVHQKAHLKTLESGEEKMVSIVLLIALLMATILFYEMYTSRLAVMFTWCMVASVTFMIICAVILIVMGYMRSRQMREWQQKEALDLTNSILSKSYAEIVQKNEELNQLRHDFKKHLHVIRNMPEAEIRAYIDDLLNEKAEKVAISHTGDPYVDAVLNSKMKDIQGLQIDFSYQVNLPGVMMSSPSDLCAILYNQLENAIEACAKIEDVAKRKLSLEIDRKGGMLSIDCSNAIEPGTVTYENLKHSSKRNTGEAGYGLINIRTLAERHGGSLSCEIDDDCFCSRVVMMVE